MPQIPLSQENYSFAALPTENASASGMADNALAEGLGRVDQAFGMVAERARHMQQLTDAATIDSSNAVQLGALQLKYATDPDPSTAPQRFAADATAMKAASVQGIADPNVQALVSRNFDQRVVSHSISLQQTSFKAQQMQQDAGIRGSLDDYSKAIAAAPNPDEAGRNVDMAHAALAGGVAAGIYTPLQQRTLLSQSVRQAVELRSTDGSANAATAADGLMQQYAPLLTAADQVALAQHLKPQLLHAQVLAGVSAITGGAAGGAAATAGVSGAPADLGPLIDDAADRHGIPRDLARAHVAQESNFNPNLIGGAGEIGLTQIKPSTATAPGYGMAPVDPATLKDSRANLDFGLSYLAARGKAAGVTDWNDPAQRANGLQAYNGGGDPLYVQHVTARMSGTSAGTPGMPTFQAPDLNDWIDKARTMAGGDPEMEQRLVAGVTARYSQWHSATQVQRAQLGKTLGDTQAALADGRDLPIPETQIRSLFPAEQADDIMDKLREAQGDGQVMSAVRLMSPEDIASTRAQLADGVGPVDPITKLPTGKKAAIGGDPNTLPAPAPTDAADLTGYRQKAQALVRFDKAVATRNASLVADPARFVAQAPAVSAAAQAVDPQSPATFEAFDVATRAEQTRLGVPDNMQRTLSVPQIQSTVQQLTSADPAKTDVGATLNGLATQYGAAWPHVFGDLVRVGKLPREYQMLGMMDQPGQAPARQDLTRALQATAQRGGMHALEGDAPPDQVKAINGALDDAIGPFRQTASVPGINGNVQQIADVRDTVRQLALFYTVQGMDGATAVTKAADGILGQKYDFGSNMGSSSQATMRVPAGMWNRVDTATRGVVGGLKPSDLAPVSATGNTEVDAQRQADTLKLVKSGVQWVPNEDDSGLVAYVRPRDGSVVPVKLANGGRMEVKFNALPTQPAPVETEQPPVVIP